MNDSLSILDGEVVDGECPNCGTELHMEETGDGGTIYLHPTDTDCEIWVIHYGALHAD